MTDLVAVDIGGTHARFALAGVADGRVTLGECVTMRTGEHASFQLAWEAFAAHVGRPLPAAAAIAIACPVQGDVLKLTNNPWVIRQALIPEKLHVERWTLVNDFAAVAHAVAVADAADFQPLCGPATRPSQGVTTVVGPGTGLGVAQLLRGDGPPRVIATEGGHIDFAPLDSIDDAILRHLRARYRRVSVERVACGPGLLNIYEALAGLEGRAAAYADDRSLWAAALSGHDSLAAAAFDRFCLALGGVAGDLALAHGAAAVVIAGGLGRRIADRLAGSGFAERFAAKGRFETMMRAIPVTLITIPEPGLVGAAAAFAAEHP